MSLRFLLGILAPEPPDEEGYLETLKFSNEDVITVNGKEVLATTLADIQNQAKFHIGMLSISLIIGLAYVGFVSYKCWMEKIPFLSYVRNLVIALVLRTFFSLVFDGAILLGSPTNVGGGNTLLAFEQIYINLVLAFWLTLTIYMHARVQRNFKSEPTLNLYKYGVPAVALFFAFIWIFLLQDQCPSWIWWFTFNPFSQWIVNSFNLLCLLIQLGLAGDIVRMGLQASFDNDSISLLRKITIMMGVLVFVFWLQLGLFIGRLPMKNSSSYAYFFYFVDGIECALVCVVLYFLGNWVRMLIKRIPNILVEETPSNSLKSNNEELLAGNDGRGIVTIDSVFMTKESAKWKNSEEEGARDVVYSNVVKPQRLKNILGLYKRLNKVPSNQATVVEGEEFFECQLQEQIESSKSNRRPVSDECKQKVSIEGSFKNEKLSDQTQKRTAFYSSKYLILDSKGDIPKYLETRPSLSSKSGRSSLREDALSKDYTSNINIIGTEELVQKWLSDNSENMQRKQSVKQRIGEVRDRDRKNSESKMQKQKFVFQTAATAPETMHQTYNRVSFLQKNDAQFNPVFWDAFSGTDRGKNTDDNSKISVNAKTIKKDLSSELSTREGNREEAQETEVDGRKQRERKQSLNSIIKVLMNTMLSSSGKDKETSPKNEVVVAKEGISSKHDISSPVSTEKVDSIKDEEAEMTKSQQVIRKPALIEKDNKANIFSQIPIPPSQYLDSKHDVHVPDKNDQVQQEIPPSSGIVSNEKGVVPIVPKPEDKNLNLYLTYSELQEYRRQREIEQGTQGPKSFIESFLEIIILIWGFMISKKGSSKLQESENLRDTESEEPQELLSDKSEIKTKTEFEEKINKHLATGDPLELDSDKRDIKIETEFEEQSKVLDEAEKLELEGEKPSMTAAADYDYEFEYESTKQMETTESLILSEVKGAKTETELEEQTSKPVETAQVVELQSEIKDMRKEIEFEEQMRKDAEIAEPLQRQSGKKERKTKTESEGQMSRGLEVVGLLDLQTYLKSKKNEIPFEEPTKKILEDVEQLEPDHTQEIKLEMDLEKHLSQSLELEDNLDLRSEKKRTKEAELEQMSKLPDVEIPLELQKRKKEIETEFDENLSKPIETLSTTDLEGKREDERKEIEFEEQMRKHLEVVVPQEQQTGKKETKTEKEVEEQMSKPVKITLPKEQETKKTSELEDIKCLEIVDPLALQSEDVLKKETELEEQTKKPSLASSVLPLKPPYAETTTGRFRSGRESTSSDSEFSIEKGMKISHPDDVSVTPPSVRKSTHSLHAETTTRSFRSGRESTSSDSEFSTAKNTSIKVSIPSPFVQKYTYLNSTDEIHRTDNEIPLESESSIETDQPRSSSSSGSGSNFSLEDYYNTVSYAKTKTLNVLNSLRENQMKSTESESEQDKTKNTTQVNKKKT